MLTGRSSLVGAIAGAIVALAIAVPQSARAQEPTRVDGWVVLAIDDYRSLRARAFPAAPNPATPPVDATLTRVDYDLRGMEKPSDHAPIWLEIA